MRSRTAGTAALVVALLTVGTAVGALPLRTPDVEAVVEKVVPATEAERKTGVLVVVFLKDRKDGVPITKDTAIHKQMGKLVPIVEVAEITAGSKVSVWVNAKSGVGEGVLIFP